MSVDERSSSKHQQDEGAQSSPTGEQPPVLPVSHTGGGEASGQDRQEMQQERSEGEPRSFGAGGGVSDLWGLSEKIDAWQVSSLPEDQQYFAIDVNVLDAAIVAIKARLNEEKDGKFLDFWLLTEIDHWDLERERVVVLTDKFLISIKYDFIHTRVEELRYVSLSRIIELLYGDFKYTSSYIFNRAGKGLKVSWGVEQVGFLSRWNPFSEVKYTIFTSHVLVRRGKIRSPKYEIESAVEEIERAILDNRSEVEGGATPNPPPAIFEKKEGDIVFDTMLGVSALVFNQSNLGFNKKRGALDF